MNAETLIGWIKEDTKRMSALHVACKLNLPEWCLAAGFVRNLAWDKFHHYEQSTPLNDIDLIYFDPQDKSEERDRTLEQQLKNALDLPWSVKNQARMHSRNRDAQYRSTADAMSYWVEVETAVGVRLNSDGDLKILAPFDIKSLFSGTITLNLVRPKPNELHRRIRDKHWLYLWPNLKVVSEKIEVDGH